MTSPEHADPVAKTTAGSVRGSLVDGSCRFLGIPFAAAPVGPRRFRPPAPVDAWDGERECTSPGPVCPQLQIPEGFSPLPDLTARDLPMSEDCLSLNVFTPALDDGRRPTVVWIHGGAFIGGTGSSAVYDSAGFVRDEVVLVTVNYRLHALGFLYLDEHFDIEGSGNHALLDQIAALAWVRENIEAFGGDASNVTIVGESAGAMSIGTLLAAPAATGLFRRAALYSGASQHNLRPTSARRVTERVLELVGVAAGDWSALLDVPSDQLYGVSNQVAMFEIDALLADEAIGVRTVFAPVIDGKVLPDRALEVIAGGASDGVDVLVSTNADEYRLFMWGMPEAFRDMVPTPDIAAYFPGGSPSPADVATAYADVWPDATPRDIGSAVAGDAVFGIPAVRLAEAKAGRGDRVWMQQLTWRTPAMAGELGACHALDIPFLFESLDHPGFVGEDPPAALADDLHGAFVRFAKTGDPNGGRLPGWEPYSPDTRAVMRLDVEPTLVHDPDADRRALWNGVW